MTPARCRISKSRRSDAAPHTHTTVGSLWRFRPRRIWSFFVLFLCSSPPSSLSSVFISSPSSVSVASAFCPLSVSRSSTRSSLSFQIPHSPWTPYRKIRDDFSTTSFYTTATAPTTTTTLMGIKGFRSWFESQFPRAITGMPKEMGTGSGGIHPEEFDHVLIDMNQILHVVLRKSRSEGHALTLLMKELDACLALAIPTQSLVLAMDGSPGAAKLATQRRRRYQTVRKTESKVAQLDKLIGASKSNPSKRARKNIKQWTRKRIKALVETRTLCITPGTEFMEKAEQTLLYWAWQRLSSRQTLLSVHNVKVFVSPSTVPGEGEVKLLEWIYTKPRRGESIAMLGGDSDLVLEALVIPVASTHNVFVLLPDGNSRYLAVSLWETTRTLVRYLPNIITTPAAMIQIRTDLVLLLILNGNDYLPKLRGSSGFNKLFHTYLRLQREWHANTTTALELEASGVDGSLHRRTAFLVDPDTLQFNLEFARAFFHRLAAMTPAHLWKKASNSVSNNNGNNGPLDRNKRDSPLQQLNILLDGGFLPKPIKFMIVEDDANDNDDNDDDIVPVVDVTGDDDNDDVNDSGVDEDDDVDTDEEESDANQVLVRLQLGVPGTEDFFTYEIRHTKNTSLKKAKHKLAAIALSDFMDEEGNAIDEDEEEDLDDAESGGASTGYDWEIHHNVEGHVERYLYGLLWNLQTYQDGVCANYSFNYGKRMSPLAQEIAACLDLAILENRTVGQRDLYPLNEPNSPFSQPISAGLSCLAALPSPVKHLVPEPYRWLPDGMVENFYASCMDPEDNVFDIKKFERLCHDKLLSMDPPKHGNVRIPQSTEQSEYPASDHYWTVVSKVPKPLSEPCDPPKPFSDRHAQLKANNKIRISRYLATSTSRSRESGQETKTDNFVDSNYRGNQEGRQARYSDPGSFFEKMGNIDKIDYRVAYQKSKERKGLRKGKVTLTLQGSGSLVANGADIAVLPVTNGLAEQASILTTHEDVRNVAKPVPSEFDPGNVVKSDETFVFKYNSLGVARFQPPVENLDGETAMAVLKQLGDLELIGPIKWEILTPSPSDCAAHDRRNHELVRLCLSRSVNKKALALQKTVAYEQDRDVNTVARKLVQQHLASAALDEITGVKVRWAKLTYNDLKKILTDSMVA